MLQNQNHCSADEGSDQVQTHIKPREMPPLYPRLRGLVHVAPHCCRHHPPQRCPTNLERQPQQERKHSEHDNVCCPPQLSVQVIDIIIEKTKMLCQLPTCPARRLLIWRGRIPLRRREHFSHGIFQTGSLPPPSL